MTSTFRLLAMVMVVFAFSGCRVVSSAETRASASSEATTPISQQEPTPELDLRRPLDAPLQNVDHWHAVYGVYSCMNLGEGDAKYLPPFQSSLDDTGIHSHGDGLIHIHPFFLVASGDNAQLHHWFSEMNVEVTPERILINNIFDPNEELVAGQECADGSGKAEIKVLHWYFDFQALSDDRPSPEVITEDLGLINFENDREVYIFAYIGENTDLADIPLPPSGRFDTLNMVSSAIEYLPAELQPAGDGVSEPNPEDDDAAIEELEGE